MHFKKLREARGYSQLNLAKQLGISQANLSTWESGKVQDKFFTIDQIHSMCNLLGVDLVALHHIVYGTEEMADMIIDEGIKKRSLNEINTPAN